MQQCDSLIIGGGVIGLMTAWQLAEAGHDVILVERGTCGREASWAGGGIVSPLYPWRYSEAVSQLACWAEGFYPEIAARLAAETGIDPEYRQKGLLYLRIEGEDRAQAWAHKHGVSLQRIDAECVYAKEPHLVRGIDDGLWMPKLGSIRNPRLCRALRARIEALPNVTLHEHTAVEALQCANERLTSVRTSRETFVGDRTIVCSGAWSGGLLADIDVELPVRPVKGQMMLFRTPPGPDRMLLERVVLMDGRYLIPRADGRVLVGSTLEDAEFDQTTTDQARASLYESAIGMVPALADYGIEYHWAGLRPGSPDEIPFIGAVPGVDGLFVNAGHYRNGLVLAPAATRLLVDQLLGRTPILDPSPYQPADLGVAA